MAHVYACRGQRQCTKDTEIATKFTKNEKQQKICIWNPSGQGYQKARDDMEMESERQFCLLLLSGKTAYWLIVVCRSRFAVVLRAQHSPVSTNFFSIVRDYIAIVNISTRSQIGAHSLNRKSIINNESERAAGERRERVRERGGEKERNLKISPDASHSKCLIKMMPMPMQKKRSDFTLFFLDFIYLSLVSLLLLSEWRSLAQIKSTENRRNV